MSSIWLKMSNSKIPHFRFCRFFKQSVTKIMGKTVNWAILCFSPLLPLNNVEEQWAKLRQAILWVRNIVSGESGSFKCIFQIPIIFCHWLSEIWKKKKKKEEVWCMLFQINKICFNKSDYATLHSLMRIMTEKQRQNDAKIVAIMVLSYSYLAPLRKMLLQAHHDRFCSFVKLLCIYFCYFNLLNHG